MIHMSALRICFLLSSAVLSAALSGCGNNHADGQKSVVTTIGMISDLVRNVAGDTVRVDELMGPGVDPHLYKPTLSDGTKLARADLILYNGLHLEGNMHERLHGDAKARAVARLIPDGQLLSDGGEHDPHIWFDVRLWIHALNAVEKDLCELQPHHAEKYKANAAKYRAELEALHIEVRDQLATIPEQQRVLVTAHDAFRYFGQAYKVEVVGLQGVSTANEAGLKEVDRVVDLVVNRKLKAIFTESSVPPDGIKKVIQLAAARGHTVKAADGELFSDAMGARGSPEGTYAGMVRHNVRLIVSSLK
jgi:manganese/zinc/iron transport system substrate-binding protein